MNEKSEKEVEPQTETYSRRNENSDDSDESRRFEFDKTFDKIEGLRPRRRDDSIE
jgi:hypothetical protein